MNSPKRHTGRRLVALSLALSPVIAQADHVPTAINRAFIDPASLPVVVDGYQGGDEVSFIFETTPEITGGATSGVGAWSTVYLPRGARVFAAERLVDSGGVYVTIPARDLATMSSAEPGGAGGDSALRSFFLITEDVCGGPGLQDVLAGRVAGVAIHFWMRKS